MFTQTQKVIWLCIFAVLSGIFYTLQLNALGFALGVCTAVTMFCALLEYLNGPSRVG